MRPNWLHRASQSASEGPVVYIRSRGEFHEDGFALGWKCRMARRSSRARQEGMAAAKGGAGQNAGKAAKQSRRGIKKGHLTEYLQSGVPKSGSCLLSHLV